MKRYIPIEEGFFWRRGEYCHENKQITMVFRKNKFGVIEINQ